MAFVHLHTHTHYSILEGLPKPSDYVAKAKDLGMKAVAITDTGNLHWCHEMYLACKKAGITPILWCEVFVKSETDSRLNHKLVLLAKSLKGYQNIIALASKASLDNAGQTACVEFDDLQYFSGDVVCLSGPIHGEIPYYILSGKSDEEIVARVRQYQEIYWVENYYLEILYHQDIPKQQLVTDKMIELYNDFNIPLVACQNSYYIEKQDKMTQDVIMALGTGHEIENPDRPTLTRWDYSFLSEQEMTEIFGYIPEALENTQKIADMVDIEIETGGILIPTFELPEDMQKLFEEALDYQKNNPWKTPKKELSSDEWYLRYLSYSGLNWRYKDSISKEILFELVQKIDMPWLQTPLVETAPDELKALSLIYYGERKKEILAGLNQQMQERIERLEYELVVVHEMWFNAYFLIVERFLNPARVSMPDIDTDFADNDRDRVVEYCRNKYGADRVAQICTFGTFAARAAVKDVGRVMWIPFQEMNELVKLIPEKPGTKLAGALEDSPEFKQAYDDGSRPKYRQIIDNALKIEGNVRQLWVHACAVIIAPEPMTNFTALAHPPKDAESIVTQYSAYPLEDLGLLKMDFLWLRNLTIIKRAQEIIEHSKGSWVDILDVPLDDQKVYKIFADGDTTWVFQFESEWMRKYLKDLAPDSFEDLIAMVSLYRPWPLAYIPAYIDRKYGREEIMYMTDDLREILTKKKYSEQEIEEEKRKLEEDLKKILDVTYGIAVYQEQLMFIVQYMAGFSLGEADILRRWVWKKKLDVVEALKIEFINKSAEYKNYKPETSQYIYEEMIMPAANYSFNKSHAACYAFIAYQTAYLKAHYRTEFLTSMMTSDEENMDRIILEVSEAQANGIEIMRPDINESLKHFTYVDDTHIRFGLKAIKGLWDGPIDAILQARKEKPFEDINDFIQRWGRDILLKKSLEALIYAWAMDQFWERWTLLANIDGIIRASKNEEKKRQSSQIGLFESGLWGDDFDDTYALVPAKPLSFEEKLFAEKDVMGYMVSGHPLDGLQRYCKDKSRGTKILKTSIESLKKVYETSPEEFDKQVKDSDVKVVWIVVDLRKIVTKNGKNMAFLYCEGFDYEFEVMLYNSDYDDYFHKISVGKVIVLEWSMKVNLEYGRKTVNPKRRGQFSVISLTNFRDFAENDGMLTNAKRKMLWAQEIETLDQSEETSTNNELEEKISENKTEKAEKNKQPKITKYIVEIPAGTKLEQIHNLKDFLSSQESGVINIYILLSGKEIDTKFSLSDLQDLHIWETQNL